MVIFYSYVSAITMLLVDKPSIAWRTVKSPEAKFQKILESPILLVTSHRSESHRI